jgi:hypothetical protein
MQYSENGLFFEWGIDDDVVWIVEQYGSRPLLLCMDEALRMLRMEIGSIVNVNILCMSSLGRWDVVHTRQGSRGYDMRSLGDAQSLDEARRKVHALFGAGARPGALRDAVV